MPKLDRLAGLRSQTVAETDKVAEASFANKKGRVRDPPFH